ncbi:MAG: hypothetical protein WCC66_14070 [Rhizobiaceae bacterium]
MEYVLNIQTNHLWLRRARGNGKLVWLIVPASEWQRLTSDKNSLLSANFLTSALPFIRPSGTFSPQAAGRRGRPAILEIVAFSLHLAGRRWPKAG